MAASYRSIHSSHVCFCLADADFDDSVITLDFPIGSSPTAENRRCGLIFISDDNLVEGPEFFTVEASPAVVFFDASTATVTITDDDGEFSCQCKYSVTIDAKLSFEVSMRLKIIICAIIFCCTCQNFIFVAKILC